MILPEERQYWNNRHFTQLWSYISLPVVPTSGSIAVGLQTPPRTIRGNIKSVYRAMVTTWETTICLFPSKT